MLSKHILTHTPLRTHGQAFYMTYVAGFIADSGLFEIWHKAFHYRKLGFRFAMPQVSQNWISTVTLRPIGLNVFRLT
jgi:hypothetical protein